MPDALTIKSKQMKKKLKRILLLLLIIASATAIYAYKEFNRKNKSVHEMEIVASFKSDAILQQFSTDEKKATATYNGKPIAVEGNIKSVDKDEKGFYTIVLGTESSSSSVRCSIDSTESSVASALQTNTTVKIKGICTGYNADELGLGSDLILNRCIIDIRK